MLQKRNPINDQTPFFVTLFLCQNNFSILFANGKLLSAKWHTNRKLAQLIWYMWVKFKTFFVLWLQANSSNHFYDHRNWRTCPRMAQTGIPLLIFSPRFKAGTCTLTNHVDPSMLPFIYKHPIDLLICSNTLKCTQNKIAMHYATRKALFLN